MCINAAIWRQYRLYRTKAGLATKCVVIPHKNSAATPEQFTRNTHTNLPTANDSKFIIVLWVNCSTGTEKRHHTKSEQQQWLKWLQCQLGPGRHQRFSVVPLTLSRTAKDFPTSCVRHPTYTSYSRAKMKFSWSAAWLFYQNCLKCNSNEPPLAVTRATLFGFTSGMLLLGVIRVADTLHGSACRLTADSHNRSEQGRTLKVSYYMYLVRHTRVG